MEVRSSTSTRWETLDASKKALLQQRLQAAAGLSRRLEVPTVQAESRTNFALSSAQQRIWLMEKLNPGTPMYNLAEILRFRGSLDIHALIQSISELLCRHASLRTVFREQDDEPVQIVRAPAQVFPSVTSIRGETKEDQQREVQAILSDELHRPFDLQNGPLIRIRLLKVSDSEHILVLAMHHIITDGWSNGILVNELCECYRSFARNEKPSLLQSRFGYADFVEWQQAWLRNGDHARTLNYWKEKLSDFSRPVELTSDYPRNPSAKSRGAVKRFCIRDELCVRLRELSRNEGATLFMTALAAFKILLNRYTQSEDIVVGSPVANRNRLEFERVVGCFINMLVLRTRVNNRLTFREILQRVRETSLEAYAHQDMPFERLVMELRPPRSSNVSPFFQIAFMFENFPARDVRLPGLEISRISDDTDTAKFDVTLVLAPDADNLYGAIEYRADLFTPETIDGFVREYCTVLEKIAANPNLRVAQLF